MSKPLSFKRALARLPSAVVGGFDPYQHKTVDDLRFLVQHEIDLYEEGEETYIRNLRSLNACRRFLAETA